MFNITKGISSLYISGKKRKRSDYLKPDADISTKLQNLKDKFKDLALLYDELEDQLTDVHFMNISDIKYHKKKDNKQKYNNHNNIPNSHKNFNYNYNNLNDYYYSLYKKLTNKKQKTTYDNDKRDEEYRKLYNIDKEISLNFNDTEINKLGVNSDNSNKDNNINNNTNVNDTKNGNNNISKSAKSSRLKKNRHCNSRYHNSSTKQNNFIPSGIKIPKKFISNDKESNKSDKNKSIPLPSSPLKPKSLFLNENIVSKSSNSFFINHSRSSLVSSNSDTIRDNIEINNNKRKFNSSSIPYLTVNPSAVQFDNISKSTFLEDLNDYVEKGNEDNGTINNNAEIAVHSTCSKLNTIPYNSFQTQNDLLNIMNESKLKTVNYLKLYSSRSIRNSSSDFILESSSESVKDKKDCIIWNKNLNINDYNNNYYHINPPDDSDDDNDPFEDISDLTISSDEREQHLSINNINEGHSKQPLHHHHHHTSQYEEKRFKRARNNSNTSEASNLTSASTVTTETTTTTTTTSGITNENDHYQDDNTYSELLNNPMKKHEIYQMEKSHNTFMKSWLDFENKIYSNLNYFIENDFIDLYDFLCQKSDTINSNQDNNSIDTPLP